MPDNKNNMEDYDLNDILIHQLAKHIEEGGVLEDHYLYTPQSDLFEYEQKIEVESSKIGLDILEQIRNNGKQE